MRIFSILVLLAIFSDGAWAELSAEQQAAYLKNCSDVCRAPSPISGRTLEPAELIRCDAHCRCDVGELRKFSQEEWALLTAIPPSDKIEAFRNAVKRFNQVLFACREKN